MLRSFIMRSGCVAVGSVAVCLLASTLPVFAQQSGGYILERMSAAAGATRMTSAIYDNTVAVAEGAPAGAASVCGGSEVSSFGFWSVLGDLAVPVILQVRRSSNDPSTLDLVWTGDAAQFQVCRGVDPNTLCSTVYAYTFVCAYTAHSATNSHITYYSVIPTP